MAKSDIIEHRIGSELNVRRCLRVSDEELACEPAARLALISSEREIAAVFNANPEGWRW